MDTLTPLYDQAVTTEDLAADAIQAIEHLLLTDLVAVAWSGGKDSTAVLILSLCAALNLRKRGLRHPPILVLHNDTEIENPSVRALADEQLERLDEWAMAENIPLSTIVSTPSLTDTWAVKVLGGRALPRWPGHGKGDCATDWKRTPADRASKRAFRNLEELYRQEAAKAGPDSHEADVLRRIKQFRKPAVLLGSRKEESISRAASIARHRQTAVEVTEIRENGQLISRTFSPIVDWTVMNVWELIAYAGTDGDEYPVWMESKGFAELNTLYKDATGSCVIIPGPHQRQAAACGARFGCWACCRVSHDKSLNTMLMDDAYGHLRPLSSIRDFMANIRWDMSRRHWLGRRVDPVTTHLRIGPDTLADQTLEEIALAVLSADRDEALRARSFARAVNAGQIPDDSYLQALAAADKPLPQKYLDRMVRPQFRTLDPRKIIALDFMWSLFGRHGRPFHALALTSRVWHDGERHDAPVARPLPQVPVDEDRWLPLTFPPGAAAGIGDPIAVYAQEGCTGSAESIRLPSACGDAVAPPHRQGLEFDVDEEAAGWVLSLEWDNGLRAKHEDPAQSVTAAALYYLRMGVVQVSGPNQAHFHRILQRTEAIERSGLQRLSIQDLVARSITNNEHSALVAKATGHPATNKPSPASTPAPLQEAFSFDLA